jgi:hypothetical protein
MGNRDTPPTRRSVSSPGRSWRDTSSARPGRAEPWESSVVEDVAYTDVEQAQQAREAQASKVFADRPAESDPVDDRPRASRQPPAVGHRTHQNQIPFEVSDGSPPQASPVPPHRLQDDEYVEPAVNAKPAFGRNSLIALAAATALGVLLVSLDVWRSRADATLAITQSTSGMASASAVPAVAPPNVTTAPSRSDGSSAAAPTPSVVGVSSEKAPSLAPGIASPITIITSSTTA